MEEYYSVSSRGCEDVGCVRLDQDRVPLEGCYCQGNEPSVSIKCGDRWVTLSFSRRPLLTDVTLVGSYGVQLWAFASWILWKSMRELHPFPTSHTSVMNNAINLINKLPHFRAVQKSCAAIHHEGATGEEDLGARWGEWLASRPGRALPPGKGSRYLLDKRLGGPR
jgi:hypothetical protein